MDKLHTTFKNRLIAKDIHYGLDAQGIVDNDWFWNEVWLRSVNNYGQWKGKKQAREWILKAITEICQDVNWSNKRTTFLIIESKRQIKMFVEDMTARWNN